MFTIRPIRSVLLTAAMATTIFGSGILNHSRFARAEPPPKSIQSDLDASDDLEVRFARAHLRLAELDLRRVLQAYEKFPDMLPEALIEDMRRHIEVDKEQLKQAKRLSDKNVYEIQVRSAELAVDLAKADLARKRLGFSKVPKAHSAIDVERAQAVLDLAKINLQRVRAQEGSFSTLSYLQWQVESLRNDLLEIRIELEKVKGR